MKFNSKYYELYKDNYNIYNLIKKINHNYNLYYNKAEKNFVIVNSANNNEICMKITYISSEILKNLQITRKENAKNLLQDIENYNYDLKTKNLNLIKQKVVDKAANLTKFSNRVNHLNLNDLNKIIGE